MLVVGGEELLLLEEVPEDGDELVVPGLELGDLVLVEGGLVVELGLLGGEGGVVVELEEVAVEEDAVEGELLEVDLDLVLDAEAVEPVPGQLL